MTIQDSISNLPKNQVTKICTKCGCRKPATTDFFHKDNQKKDGLRPECKVCLKLRNAQPDKRASRIQYMKDWHSKNDQTEYNNDPKNKERKAAWSKEYNKKPERKLKNRDAARKRYADPECRAHIKELLNTPEQRQKRADKAKIYSSKPEVKARVKIYGSSPERKAYGKAYRQRPDVKLRDNKRRRHLYKTDPERRAKRKAYGQEYKTRPEVKEKNSLKKKERIATDPQYRLNNAISCSMRRCLNGGKKSSTFEILDFTIEQLKEHLEAHFTDGMTWENYGKNGWEVDHIIPVAAHNFEKESDEDFKRCWSLKNLQPLWGKKNASKSANLKKPFQKSLIFGGEDNDS